MRRKATFFFSREREIEVDLTWKKKQEDNKRVSEGIGSRVTRT